MRVVATVETTPEAVCVCVGGVCMCVCACVCVWVGGWPSLHSPSLQGFIQDFALGGGGEQDGSRKILNLYTSQIASDAIWDEISEHFDDTYLRSVTCK